MNNPQNRIAMMAMLMNALEQKQRNQDAANMAERMQAEAVRNKVNDLVELNKVRNPAPMKLTISPVAFKLGSIIKTQQ